MMHVLSNRLKYIIITVGYILNSYFFLSILFISLVHTLYHHKAHIYQLYSLHDVNPHLSHHPNLLSIINDHYIIHYLPSHFHTSSSNLTLTMPYLYCSFIACDPARYGHMGSSKYNSFNTITALGDLHTTMHCIQMEMLSDAVR
ncbi:MAG: hypothetical protein ACI8RD_004797 [Bacillariaceae sp.]|jgi:hypothetical protein